MKTFICFTKIQLLFYHTICSFMERELKMKKVLKNKEKEVLSILRGIGSSKVLTWVLDSETRVEWS